jgi:hypothetical protein
MIDRFNAQFAHPEGWVEMILALKNRERNARVISSLDSQANDHVLEVGISTRASRLQTGPFGEEADQTDHCRERHRQEVNRLTYYGNLRLHRAT